MCGIAGLVLTANRRVPSDVVRRVSESLVHRGPDDEGYLFAGSETLTLARTIPADSDAAFGLAHRRLSILDLSPAGRQPMASEDNRHFIVFNGEIYNYRELRSELESNGCRFRSGSDTEVLLSAYLHWGTAVLNRLVGMFAFAVYDHRLNRLFLARDPFGIKPLYYCRWTGGFAFASEIKTLLLLPGVSRRADEERTYDYLRYGLTDHDGGTLLGDVKQLPSACYAELECDGKSAPVVSRYWDLEISERADMSFDQAADGVRELFTDSVRLHLRSDVPVGSALSGGIDSSAIVATMRRLQGKDLELHTFSYIPDDPSISEEPWVDLANQAAGAISHKVRAGANQLGDGFEKLINVQDEPCISSSMYAQLLVFQLAQQYGIAVMLDGQGGDELFGGYPSYFPARLASILINAEWTGLAPFLRAAGRYYDHGILHLFVRAVSQLLPPGAQRAAGRVRDLNAWISKPRSAADLSRRSNSAPSCRAGLPLKAKLRQEILTTSLPRLLRYEDRNSMAHSIETRVPFLTPALARFAMSVPEKYFITDDGTTKAVFRRAMRGIVPQPILDRRDKVGFITPETLWLRENPSWVQANIDSVAVSRNPVVNYRAVKRLSEEVLSGRRSPDSCLWRCLNFAEWARLHDVEVCPAASR